jgi:hypothetical protein
MKHEQQKWVRVSRGALEGVEGEVVRELDDRRVLVAVGASDQSGAVNLIAGAYVAVAADCVESVDRKLGRI